MPDSARLDIRLARDTDIDAIVALSNRTYGRSGTYLPAMVQGQLARFPEGQFVAVLDGTVVGYCATFRIDGETAMAPHSWSEITGGGYAARHDEVGDWLYGMEVCVDPAHRGRRIGRRLYDCRKRLCQNLELRGIVFAGRMPLLAKRIKSLGSPQAYLDAVMDGSLRDPTLGFQMRNGFEPVRLLPDYLPSDAESMGQAVLLRWRNPNVSDHPVIRAAQKRGWPDAVRIATVQYQQRRIDSFEAFATQVEYFVDVAADYRSDFVLFPELFTLQLLSIENKKLSPEDSIRALTRYTSEFKALLVDLAVKHNINIIGGSHPTVVDDGDIHNICYVALRDGSLHEQEKIHITPNERRWWKIKGGDTARAINTDCGPIGVMICYDSEFPELGRHLVDQGAMILFVPYCTDVRQGHLRVRYSCLARATENQCYVVTSGNCGNLPGVNNFDIQYAQSGIFTPCDFPFAPEGIAADTTPNTEAVAFADLRLDDLVAARQSGTVLNLRDRRHDLYSLRWADANRPDSPLIRKPEDA